MFVGLDAMNEESPKFDELSACEVTKGLPWKPRSHALSSCLRRAYRACHELS